VQETILVPLQEQHQRQRKNTGKLHAKWLQHAHGTKWVVRIAPAAVA
jgi:hypothetical protein